MAFCSFCGRPYLVATGKVVKRPMVAKGTEVQVEFPIGKCGECARPGEEVDLVLIGEDDLYGVHGR